MITENIVLDRNFSWIDIENPLRVDYDFIEQEFGLPPLIVQDCLRPEHLPKFEKTNNGYFFLTRIYDPNGGFEETINVENLTNKLAIFISQDRMMTLHNEILTPLRTFMDMRDTTEFPRDTRKLTHQLFRISLMSFEAAILKLQKSYEIFEHGILSKNSDTLSNTKVYEFRRQLYVLKGVLQLTQASLTNSRDFWKDHHSLMQDIKENIDQLYFRLDDLSHNFDQLFALHISISEQKNNDTMKILTVFSSVMLPLTFIASFYGMNFDHIPGLHTPKGLAACIILMVVSTFTTIWFFNRKRYFQASVK